MSLQEAKKAAGKKAAEWIESGMIVGLGTGSTAACFIDCLIKRCKMGLRIQAVSSSHSSALLAARGGIEVLDINSVPRVDITVDGADEVDPKKRMIKGGGGAHVREKILAAASTEMIVVVDDSKLVDSVGVCKLPVEILFYGSPSTRKKLEEAGYQGRWRMNEDNSLFITENGNLLFDISFNFPPTVPERDHEIMINIPGVVDTGFFFGYAGRIVIGYGDGKIRVVD